MKSFDRRSFLKTAGVATGASWSVEAIACMVAASLVLCAIGWPDSRIGLMVDIAFVVALILNARWPLLV